MITALLFSTVILLLKIQEQFALKLQKKKLYYLIILCQAKFRLAATGVVQELNHNYDIMKKLKLVGEPFKIYKNTAFIKGMFNSSLEASKFIGGVVKTVSGLRG